MSTATDTNEGKEAATGHVCPSGDGCELWIAMLTDEGSVEGLYHISEFHCEQRRICAERRACESYQRLRKGA